MAEETIKGRREEKPAAEIQGLLRDRNGLMRELASYPIWDRAKFRSESMGKKCKNNLELVDWLLQKGYAGPETAAAMAKVDRKDFVRDIFRRYAYVDMPIEGDYGQANSSPSAVATIVTGLKVEKDMKVLEIGTCTGYQAAILSTLIGNEGEFIGIERIPMLARHTEMNLLKYRMNKARVILANGVDGYETEAPYDRIVYSTAVCEVPRAAFEQLKPNGVMIAPVGIEEQELLRFNKKDGIGKPERLGPIAFAWLENDEWNS